MSNHSRRKVQIDMVAFRRDVEEGTKQIILCEKYGIATSTVSRLKAEISGKLARREEVPASAEVDPPEAFDITLNILTSQLDDLLATVTDAELREAVLQLEAQPKATFFQAILQGRMDHILDPSVELPQLVAQGS